MYELIPASNAQLPIFLLITLLLFNSSCKAFTEENRYFETVEEQASSTFIGTFSTLPNHTYRISANDESKQHIELDLAEGTIKVKQKIDREKLKSDRLTLALIDENSLSITALKIQVQDINDNSPQFPSHFYNVSLLESVSLGTRISLPAAIDPDKAENGTIVAYQLQNPSTTFALAAPSGNESASLYLISPLDREQNSTYELVLFALDGGRPKRQGQMTIFVNVQDTNEAPRFEERDYNVTVNAKVPAHQALLQVKATDVDSDQNGKISYQIQSDPTKQFFIDSESGEIFVNSEVDFLHCNRSNGQNVCLIIVEAVDGGDPPLKTRKLVRIIVNESSLYAPTLKIRTYPLGFDTAFVYEGAKPDSLVAVLTSNANLSIVAGNEGNWFRLESGNNFGIIRLIHLEPISAKQTYELVIRAQNKEMQAIQETLKLTVYDNLAKYHYLDERSNQNYSICKGIPCYSGACDSNAGCQCSASYTGVYCNERIFAFKFGSSLELKMTKNVNSFSMQFRSSSSNGLLLYSSSVNNQHFAIELLNGYLHLNGQVNGRPISTNSIPINDSSSYTILTFEFNDDTKISVDPGECSNSANCSWTFDKFHLFLNSSIFIGTAPDRNQIANPNFYGCVKSIQFNNQPLSSSLIVEERSLMQSCPFDAQQSVCSKLESQAACQSGRCQSSWEGFHCVCGGDGFEAMDCSQENQTLVNGLIRLTPSLYSRQKINTSSNSSFIRDLDDRPLYTAHNFVRHEHWSHGESVAPIDKWPSQWIELDVRMTQPNSTFFTIQTVEQKAQLNTTNGQLYYSLIGVGGDTLASLHLNGSTIINDKKWHRITVEIASDNKSIRLRVDSLYVDAVMDADFPQFLSTELAFIEIGSDSFRGCMRRLLVNNQFYSLDDSKMLEKQFFQLSVVNGTLSSGCTDFTICSMENDCSMEMLLHGISARELIIVAFVLLLLLLCTLIALQIRRRFRKHQRLTNNIQRIHNLQLISTSDSEYAYNNSSYNSTTDFAYLPSYIPIYSNISYPPSEVCSCQLKFDYEDSTPKFAPNQYYLQDGVVTKFGDLAGSQDCSISSSSTDIPLDPSLSNLTEREYNVRKVQ